MDKTQKSNDNLPKNYSSTKRERNSIGYQVAWHVGGVLIACVFIFLTLPILAWAEENFFQIINDNSNPVNPDFTRDAGYAVYVSYEGKKFLMDTGISKTSFAENMKAAGILLDNLDFVFLSHRHNDHTGSLAYIRGKRSSLRIYVPPGGGFANPEGLIELKDHLRVSPNIFLIHTHNDSGSRGVTDELSLLIKTKKGPYVFNACSHTGFATILEEAERVTGQNIFFHSGGTHLQRASEKKITATVEKLKALNVTQVSPSHCSVADRVQTTFKVVYGANYMASRLGQKVPLESASK